MKLLDESESQASVSLILSSSTYVSTYLPSTAYLMQNQIRVILCTPTMYTYKTNPR
jgi:hypothetical protein